MRTILRVLICAAIVLAVPLTLVGFAFGLPAQYNETFLGGLALKYDALSPAKTEHPRIVVVGGSGAAFALRCDLLEEALPGRAAVNFGLYAGLGTTVMLDLAATRLRAGDVVIFMPEQSAQTLSTYFSAASMWQAADGRPDLLPALGGGYAGPMAGAFPAFAASKARLYRDAAAPAGDGVYARASFNAWGDIDAPGRERNVMSGGWDPNMPVSFDPALPTEEFFNKVNAFAAACEKKGVAVYYRFCPMNAAAVSDTELARLDEYRAYLQSRLDCEILGDPARSVMDAGWFFDTNFHLNASGAAVYTAALAEDLKMALGGGSLAVDIPLPEMPSMAEAALTEGDDSDAEYFIYEASGGALRIAALTEAGRTRERLTLPVSRGGVPVASFDASVFAGNTAVREIVIQSNIGTIEDGSFAGCGALERIVLDNPSPASCTVGAGLLDGTDADVIVPAERLSAYRTNYFWARYASRIRAGDSPVPAPEAAPAPAANGEGILYLANGGERKNTGGDSVTLRADNAHLRLNTAQGTRYFARAGYVLTGWNTAPDGSGEHIGCGSRTERREGLTLYAEWAAAAPEADLIYETAGNEAHILAYRGSGGRCAVPETLGGLPVRRIRAGAFRDMEFAALILPSSLYVIEDGAFSGCVIGDLYLFDALREVSDAGFAGCRLTALHVNAAVSPVYSGSYYDAFSDKYDRLLSIRDEKKLVLASGSSGRYGYDSAALHAAFPDYEVVNMGVYAYTNALPQLDLIRGLTRPGDILLSAPEFDAAEYQFCAANRLDAHFWAMMESNYDAAAALDMTRYSGVLDSFGEYLKNRMGMPGRNYGESPASYDDDGNYYAFPTYNVYGDFILPRPNGDADVLLRHNIADYTVDSFPIEYIDGLNAVYEEFLSDGVAVYFTYTPRNRNSLTPESTPEARRRLHEYLAENLCVPVISDIEDSLYSGIYFWRIDSHLSTEGAALRTERVIADLRAATRG